MRILLLLLLLLDQATRRPMQAYTMLWMAAEPPTVMQHNSENIALQRSQLFLFFFNSTGCFTATPSHWCLAIDTLIHVQVV